MKLNARQVETAKPGEKDYKLPDGNGLILLVKTSGAKYWRYRYTFAGELFRLRANNLMAAENIGRWLTLLEDAEEEQQRKILMDNISAAEKAMMRNTVRIESIVGTLATVGKIYADTDYRVAATDKVSLEADRLRRDAGIDDGNGERDLNDFYADIQTDA
ncbi:DUF4102 domain-containing protein [Salmonella enterica]|nr:DUF4102 domain-containing protein [Salmonella enterica]EGC3558981.1 DUF4102 domain-containing protein [Salmonella enterica]